MKVWESGSAMRAIGHDATAPANEAFVINVMPEGRKRGGFVCYTFIGFGTSAQDAIERLKQNARNVIEFVRSRCKPEDFVEESVQYVNTEEIKRLTRQIMANDDKLMELGERDDMLAQTHRETLLEDNIKCRDIIAALKNPVPTKEQSRFNRKCARMLDMLKTEAVFEVESFPRDRFVPVSYYDDSRSVLAYVND